MGIRIKEFKIIFDDVNLSDKLKTIEAGDKLTGRIILNGVINKITGLKLILYGRARCYWKELTEDDEEIRFDDEERYIYLDVDVEIQEFIKSRQEYSFEFKLPENLPSSFEGLYGDLTYTITALLEIDNGIITKSIQNEFILNNANKLKKHQLLEFMKPIEINTTNYMLFDVGHLGLYVKLNKTCYFNGEDVFMDMKFKNESNSIIQVNLFLLQETTYRAKDNKITHTQILKTKDGPIIKPNAEENWEGNLIQIPKNCNAMLGNSKLVEIRYRFLIEMDIPGPHMNLEGEIPIIIIATAASDGLDWYPVVPEKPLENGGNENTSWIPPIPTPAENDETVEDKPEITPSASGQPELNPPGDKPKPEHDPSQPGIASDTKPDAENASSQPAISREPELNPSQPTIKPEDEPTPPNIERENKPTNKPEVKPTIEPEGKPTQPTYEPEFKPTPPNIQPENKPTIKPEDTPTQSNIKTNDRTTQSVIKAYDKPTEPTIEPKGKATQPTIKPVDTPLQPNKTNDRRTQPNIPVSPEVEPNKAYIPKDLEDNPLQPSMPREPKNKPKQPKVALEPEDSPGEPSMPEKPENNPRQPKVPLEYEDDPSAPSILRKPGNRPRQPKVSLEPEDNIRQSIVEEPELDQSTNDDTPNLMSPEPPVGNNENMAGNEVTKTSDDANTNISITELPSKTTTNNSETKGKPEETIPEDVPNKRHSRSKFRDRNQRAHTTINVFRPDQPPKQILPVPKPETWTKPINIPKIKPTEHTSQDNAHNKKTTDLPKQNKKSEYPSPKLTSESDQYCGIIQKSKPQKVKDISYSKTSCKKSGEPINTTKSKKQLPYPTFIEHQKIPKPVRKCLVNIFKVAENKILEPIGWTIKRNSCDLDDKDCKGPICLPQPSVRWSQDQG